jgi:hypothetical protein
VSVASGRGGEDPTRAETAREGPSTIRANEAGEIPVLAYHRVGADGLAPDLTISARELRRELDYLRRHGYHPVKFRDPLNGTLEVPAGKTPVVLTFDDSSDTQFTFVRRWGRRIPDPGGAVGILWPTTPRTATGPYGPRSSPYRPHSHRTTSSGSRTSRARSCGS